MNDTQPSESVNPAPRFRSRLEQEVADELDALNIVWEYEAPVVLADGRQIYYLPDFAIVSTYDEWLHHGPLPRWIEAKPQQFIYDLRDTLGVTRQYGDKFAGEAVREGITADDLQHRHIEELWKPKKLAEVTGQTVLVVGGVGGVNRLSCEMHHDRIVFTRDNWIVNHKGYQQRAARERRNHERQVEAARWRAMHEQRQADAEAERRQERATQMKVILSYPSAGMNRHPGRCPGCDDHVDVGRGNLRSVALTGGGSRWFVICTNCEATR